MEKKDKEPEETAIINPSEASLFVYCQLKWYFNNLKKSKFKQEIKNLIQ